jgi:hypothetical protein
LEPISRLTTSLCFGGWFTFVFKRLVERRAGTKLARGAAAILACINHVHYYYVGRRATKVGFESKI